MTDLMCVRCGKKADYVYLGMSLCHHHMNEAVSNMWGAVNIQDRVIKDFRSPPLQERNSKRGYIWDMSGN